MILRPIAVVGLVAVPLVLLGSTTVPNSFTDGEAAMAQQVNDNFAAVTTAIDNLTGIVRTTATVNISNSGTEAVKATCPANHVLTGGGCDFSVCCSTNLKEGHPVAGEEAYRCQGSHGYSASYTLTAYAICMPTGN